VVEPVVDAEECAPTMAALLRALRVQRRSHRLPDPIDWLHNPSVDVEWHILLHKFYYAVGLGLAWQRTGDARYVQRWGNCWPAGWTARAAGLHRRRRDRPPRAELDLQPALLRAARHAAPRAAGWRLRAPPAAVAARAGGVPLRQPHAQAQPPHAGADTPSSWPAWPSRIARAAHWREFALAQTVANLQADLLPDGVHCELSTDYHHLALRNWLHVRNLAVRNGMAVPPRHGRGAATRL
jgi:hypothetical protein